MMPHLAWFVASLFVEGPRCQTWTAQSETQTSLLKRWRGFTLKGCFTLQLNAPPQRNPIQSVLLSCFNIKLLTVLGYQLALLSFQLGGLSHPIL